MFECQACYTKYKTQLEADLCMPAELIPIVYPNRDIPVEPHELSLDWLN